MGLVYKRIHEFVENFKTQKNFSVYFTALRKKEYDPKLCFIYIKHSLGSYSRKRE